MDLLPFDQLCIEMLEGLPNSKAKHCFRSALNHLKLAEKITEIDLSMSIFRAITAEEEAATGLMLELQNKKYVNAEHLEIRSHLHKGAVIELISIIVQFLEDHFPGSVYDLSMHRANGQLQIRLSAEMIINGEKIIVIPDPPLSIAMRNGDKRFSMNKQLQILLDKRGHQTIKSHLKAKANLRNLILYANEKGYPSQPKIEDKFFPAHKRRVLTMLRIFLMIQPFEDIQPAVQDGLDIFLSIVDKIKAEDLDEVL
jgi:hypothetical protein